LLQADWGFVFPKPSRANPETQTETKTVNPKERSQTQEPTQKDKMRRLNNGKYRKITNELRSIITSVYWPIIADWSAYWKRFPINVSIIMQIC
jgi:hypothetical protein